MDPTRAPKYHKLENATDALLAALNFRGGDATGVVAISEFGKAMWQKASCDAFDFIKERRLMPYDTRSILVHTRMATQGSPAFPENNHPVRRGSVYIVHNGHVINDWEIFKKANRERFGSVDSEAIAALIAKHGIMKTHEAMEEISGAAAIGVVDETRPGLMVLARGSSSPLMFYKNDVVAVFGSTVESVKRAWTVIYGSAPKDKHIESLKEGTALYIDNDDITRKNFVPEDYFSHYGKSSYGHYGYGKDHYGYYGNNWTKWSDKELEDEKEDKSVSETYIMTESGELELFFCEHGCRAADCIVCEPDNDVVEGMATIINETDEVCEVCGFTSFTIRPFDVGEANPWYVCASCVDDLSLQLSPERMTESIHSLSDSEVAKLL